MAPLYALRMTPRRSAEPRAARVSRTATLAAGIRAHHRRWHRDPILDDAYAVRLVSPFWRLRKLLVECAREAIETDTEHIGIELVEELRARVVASRGAGDKTVTGPYS